jgi:hypothetical protein
MAIKFQECMETIAVNNHVLVVCSGSRAMPNSFTDIETINPNNNAVILLRYLKVTVNFSGILLQDIIRL